MVLYDVILVGFPEGPKIGNSEAEALSTVFGIPRELAERLVVQAPAVVKSGVTEEVCRKYFNAFVYMGARCDFLLTGEFIQSAAVDHTFPSSLDTIPGSALRLTSGELPAFVPAQETAPSKTPENKPSEPAPDDLKRYTPHTSSQRTSAEKAQSSSRLKSASVTAQGAKVRDETFQSLPDRLFQQRTSEKTNAATPNNNRGTTAKSSQGLARRSRSESETAAVFDIALAPEILPPDLPNWPPSAPDPLVERLDAPPAESSDSNPYLSPPKASIIDLDPVIGGNRKAQRSGFAFLEDHSWRPTTESASASFLLRRGAFEEFGDNGQVPSQPNGLQDGPSAAKDRGSAKSFPSVAEIREAWQAGEDISVGSVTDRDLPSVSDWDRWIDSELSDTDFPTGVAVVDSKGVSAVDLRNGTQLDAPATSRLMAQVEALKRHREHLAEPTKPEPSIPSTETPAIESAASGDFSAPLFGAPLGDRTASQSVTADPLALTKDDPSEEGDTSGNRLEPTKVPMAAMNFAKLRRKPGDDKS